MPCSQPAVLLHLPAGCRWHKILLENAAFVGTISPCLWPPDMHGSALAPWAFTAPLRKLGELCRAVRARGLVMPGKHVVAAQVRLGGTAGCSTATPAASSALSCSTAAPAHLLSCSAACCCACPMPAAGAPAQLDLQVRHGARADDPRGAAVQGPDRGGRAPPFYRGAGRQPHRGRAARQLCLPGEVRHLHPRRAVCGRQE